MDLLFGILNRLERFLPKRFRTSTPLPPLPRHPTFGLRVDAGDSLTITNLSISLEDLNEIEGVTQRTFKMRVPPWQKDFDCGATFGLSRRLDAAWFNVDQNRVDVIENGSVLEVALKGAATDPLRGGYEVAERTLDLLAAQAFRVSELYEPLREYSTWHRVNGEITLRVVTTVRLGARMRSSAIVRDPTGSERPAPKRPTMRWHPSHAYFRRSQSTDNLHEAYRNMFLALEALLSTVYPWERTMGEAAWLTKALRHVANGYGLDFSRFVATPGGNVYRRFIKEQYRARRCALFHAKVTERPTVPGDVATRDELISAIRRLGQLYVQLARLITGASFAGGAMTYAAFRSMIGGLAGSPMYVSESAEPDIGACPHSTAQLVEEAFGQPGLHQLVGRWSSDRLPQHVVRGGLLVRSGDELADGVCATLDVDTREADHLELVVQNELGNADNLREWFH